MKRSLVVGASGQVGHQIAEFLGAERAVGTFRANPPAGERKLDLEDIAGQSDRARKLLQDVEADAVYCAAAMTHVDGCESQPELALRANCEGPATLARAAAALEIPFVFFSTEYIFDGKSGPYKEADAANPISVYGRSKWEGEVAVGKAYPRALILRTTVVYGFDPAGKNFLYGLRRACSEGEIFRAASDQVSTPTYNKDLARAAVGLVRAKASGVFHVCGSELLSRYDFAVRAARAMGFDATNLVAASTAELKQIAPRPLLGGLLSHKLAQVLPEFRMRSVEEAVREWMERVAAAHHGETH